MKTSEYRKLVEKLRAHPRRGVFLVLAIIAIIGVMTFVGFAIDLGMITLTKTRMQATADAAALGAVQEIVLGVRSAGEQGITNLAEVQAVAAQAARDMAAEIVQLNGLYIDPSVDVQLGTRLLAEDGESFIETWGTPPYNMVRVTVRKTNSDLTQPDAKLRLMFAPFAGDRSQAISADATAFIESRDIVAVLDYSGSMAYDSLLMNSTVNRLTKASVESGLDEIWDELVASDVRYSDENSTKKFPAGGYGLLNSYEGTYLSTSSTSTVIEDLGIYDPGDNYWDSWSYSSSSGGYHYVTEGGYQYRKYNSGTLKRRSGYGGSWQTISDSQYPGYYESTPESCIPFPQEGKNYYGSLQGKPSISDSVAAWKAYANYVMSDSDLYNQGYRKKYGFRTLAHYLVDSRKSNSQSEDLWRAPIYPFHGMKQGMTNLATFLDSLGFGDHLGLVTYATTARIETGLNEEGADVTVDLAGNYLTENVMDIDTIQRHKQPGHYNSSTGIGYGIEEAKSLLSNQGRYGAQKAILLMTDGQSNQYPGGWSSSSLPSGWNWNEITDFNDDGTADLVIDSSYSSGGNGDGNWRAALHTFVRAKEAYDAGYTIHTISMGDGADTTLMNAIAQMSGGEYVHIPSGSSNEELVSRLQGAFAVLAGQVPPARLVIEQD
ncbi:MAG: VWA domain-containing protein [Planctomycetaceae bacterium]|nr:VWA domain-containing protein [Planctomycetaceae bacterium]